MSDHPPSNRIATCTRGEADVLAMIKVWPGVPAIVTYLPDGSWSVSTSPEDVQRRRVHM